MPLASQSSCDLPKPAALLRLTEKWVVVTDLVCARATLPATNPSVRRRESKARICSGNEGTGSVKKYRGPYSNPPYLLCLAQRTPDGRSFRQNRHWTIRFTNVHNAYVRLNSSYQSRRVCEFNLCCSHQHIHKQNYMNDDG